MGSRSGSEYLFFIFLIKKFMSDKLKCLYFITWYLVPPNFEKAFLRYQKHLVLLITLNSFGASLIQINAFLSGSGSVSGSEERNRSGSGSESGAGIEVDPDPAKCSGSGWIRIRNADFCVSILFRIAYLRNLLSLLVNCQYKKRNAKIIFLFVSILPMYNNE